MPSLVAVREAGGLARTLAAIASANAHSVRHQTAVMTAMVTAIARKVGALNKMLEARTQLKDLLTYMDGKVGAEELLSKVLKDPELLKSLAGAPKPADGGAQ